LMADAVRPQLHATAITMPCGEQFRRRYLERDIIPPGVAMIVGTATDTSVSANLQHKIDHDGAQLPTAQLADLAADHVRAAFSGGGVYLDDDDVAQGVARVRGAALDKSVRLSTLHARATAPKIIPLRVQRSWSLSIAGVPFDLVGTMDVQEATTIRDTKTTGK